MSVMTPETLRQAGLAALQRELGVVDMVRFLQLFNAGSGDYTAERWQSLDADADVDALSAALQDEKTSARS